MRGTYYVYEDWEGTFHLPKAMPKEIFDELVVMRFAELGEKELEKAEKRAMKKYNGNVGCEMLRKRYGKKSLIEDFAPKEHQDEK